MSLDAYKILDSQTPFDEVDAHNAALAVVSLVRNKTEALTILDALGLTEFERDRKNKNRSAR